MNNFRINYSNTKKNTEYNGKRDELLKIINMFNDKAGTDFDRFKLSSDTSGEIKVKKIFG